MPNRLDVCTLCNFTFSCHSVLEAGTYSCPTSAMSGGVVGDGAFFPEVIPEVKAKGIEGVGADAPIAVNAAGGKQSATPYRADLLQPFALLHLAKINKYGSDRYGDFNWHKIPISDHLNHALVHLLAHLAGDTQDDHLGHAAWRVVSALDQKLSGRDEVKA